MCSLAQGVAWNYGLTKKPGGDRAGTVTGLAGAWDQEYLYKGWESHWVPWIFCQGLALSGLLTSPAHEGRSWAQEPLAVLQQLPGTCGPSLHVPRDSGHYQAKGLRSIQETQILS